MPTPWRCKQRWLGPRGGGGRGGRGGGPSRSAITVKVTPPSGEVGHGHARPRRRLQRVAARRVGQVSLLSPRRRVAESRDHATRCARTSELLPQVHGRRHPQRDRVPGDPEMKSIVLIFRCVPAGLASRRSLHPAKLLQQPTDTWPTYNGDYSGRPLQPAERRSIPSNVHTLSLAWATRFGAGGGRGGAGAGAAAATSRSSRRR